MSSYILYHALEMTPSLYGLNLKIQYARPFSGGLGNDEKLLVIVRSNSHIMSQMSIVYCAANQLAPAYPVRSALRGDSPIPL